MIFEGGLLGDHLFLCLLVILSTLSFTIFFRKKYKEEEREGEEVKPL
jgi:hypothetical protein